ncbi:alpha/beta fold hydrolase [Brevundimonas goettingensis]|uniref:Alpha/beta fold hydrolase n=1 Tax=Brevundimonas goettingensis TaxID=2774190 RepID=A0A975C1S7_9CAUL|nr:alpha/beta fold hydrolase [Brevundimonas goettingensis]QTC91925.1 alpha/beta fold hydrolase [Brevundimonas goettingensis]
MTAVRIPLTNGLTTRVLDTGGDRRTLVLVHGLANSIEIWSRVLPRLARRFRVVAFDLPGFGEADRPVAAYDSAFFVEHLKALLDTMAIRRAHLVGSSLGAGVIVRFSERNLDRIDRAVLAAPGGFGRETHPLMRFPALPVVGDWLGRPTPANNRLTLGLAIHDQRHVTPELVEWTNRYARIPGSERSFVRTLQTGVGLSGVRERDSFEALARRFERPALVVWGRQDRVFPVRHSDRAVTLLPMCERILLDHCGHYPHWEQPDAFAAAVERFLLEEAGT